MRSPDRSSAQLRKNCTDPHQPCAVVTRQVLLTDLDKHPERILGHAKETNAIHTLYENASLKSRDHGLNGDKHV